MYYKILSTLALLSSSATALQSKQEDFYWGVATAAYQVEGAYNIDGKGLSNWDNFVTIPGRIANNDTGNVADDFYHKYVDDIEMIESLGIKTFRMSLAWARLLPDGTPASANQVGIDWYNKVLDLLEEKGITPFVTLYHWDMPETLMGPNNYTGWLNEGIQDSFNDYADFCFNQFGDRVKHWITFNEPHTFIWLGYGVGTHAPGRCSDYISADCSWVGGGGDTPNEPYIATRNMLLAHGKAVQTYRTKYQQQQGGIIGMDTDTQWNVPFDENNKDDIECVQRSQEFGFSYYNDPLHFGDYPESMKEYVSGGRLPPFTEEEKKLLKGSADFIGVNYYTSKYTQYTSQQGIDYGSDSQCNANAYNATGNLIGPFAQSTWLNVYPTGLRSLLNWISERYGKDVPIFIYENGVSVPGETSLPIAEACNDTFRVNYYNDHITQLLLARDVDGVNVQGYFAWSIMDNFEWADGYNVRFGMVYVDYADNQKRYIKQSALWYSEFIKTQQKKSQNTQISFLQE